MTIRIITDGACRGNPGPGGWAALIMRDGQVEELGGHEPDTTNNRMELRAAIEGLRRVPPDVPVHVVTDSKYLLDGITQWVHGWQRRGWQTTERTPVKNKDLWEELVQVGGTDARVTWEHVYGHRGHPENERANDIAEAYAAGKQPPPSSLLASAGAGSRDPTTRTLVDQVAAARRTGVTYLSLVNGELRRHTTWADCNNRVHGVNARYKKCKSAEEELTTVAGWGLPGEALLTAPDA